MLLVILLVMLIFALGGGGFGHSRFGYAGWSPAAIILIVIAVLFFTGSIHRW